MKASELFLTANRMAGVLMLDGRTFEARRKAAGIEPDGYLVEGNGHAPLFRLTRSGELRRQLVFGNSGAFGVGYLGDPPEDGGAAAPAGGGQ